MTVSSTSNRKTFAGNGSTTSFGTSPLVFFDSSDLSVYVTDATTGDSVTLTENTDYTVTGGDGTTGTLSLAAGSDPYGAPASGMTLVIVRTLPLTQEFDPDNGDASDADAVEEAFDKLVMIAQQNAIDTSRVLRQADSDPNTVETDISTVGRDGYYLRLNATGDAFELAEGDVSTDSFTQSGTGAVSRSVTSKLAEYVSVKDFGAIGNGVADDTAAIVAAITYADSLGGGTVYFPPGTYATSTGITMGNGTNSAPSTIHNKVKLVGAGYGSSSGVINQQVNGASRVLYTGSVSATAAALTLAGPMYGVGVEDLTLDCDAKAGRGLIVNHVTMGTFRRVSARNYTTIGYDFTTRTGNPTGCAFGCGDNRLYDCYGWVDNASLAAATIKGISLSSGVDTATSLVGQPDSARNLIFGGTFMFGTTGTSYGAYLSGADNNCFIETLFFPYGGSTSGKSVYFNQWVGSGNFPLENAFINVPAPNGIGGNGSVGSGWGNTFTPFPTSDGGALTTITGVSGVDHTGKTYIAGVRAYRPRQSSSAKLNNSVQSNSTTSAADVPGLSVTLTVLAASKLRISFSGRANKSTGGLGFFILALGGSAQGETRTDVNADGVWHAVSAEALIDIASAGAQVVTVQFTSGDTDAVQISHGSLVVEELY